LELGQPNTIRERKQKSLRTHHEVVRGLGIEVLVDLKGIGAY
jgi:hypothetical protein